MGLGHALRGIAHVLRSQRNAWIHAVATIIVVALGVVVRLERGDWLWLVLAIGLVWSAEAFNTAIESLGDAVAREPHPQIGRAKDVAAGAVLIAAVTAAVIGLMVLGPALLEWLG